MAKFIANNYTLEMTKYTPFYIVYSRYPRLLVAVHALASKALVESTRFDTENIDKFADRIGQLHESLKDVMTLI